MMVGPALSHFKDLIAIKTRCQERGYASFMPRAVNVGERMGLVRSDGRLKLTHTCCSDEYKMGVVGTYEYVLLSLTGD